MSSGSSSRSLEASRNVPRDRNPRRCWNCGRAAHLRRDCRRQPPVGKRAGARRSIGHRAGAVGAIRKVVATAPATLFWIELSLRTKGSCPSRHGRNSRVYVLTWWNTYTRQVRGAHFPLVYSRVCWQTVPRRKSMAQ